MLVTKTSLLSGKVHTMEIDVTYEQLVRVDFRKSTGELIQNIVPHLSKQEKEFLISGISPAEWEENFSLN